MSLPKELTGLIHETLDLFSKAVRDEFGEDDYNLITEIRDEMKSLRGLDEDKTYSILKDIKKRLVKIGDKELSRVSHVFSLMMEIMNRCETAIRTYKIKNYEKKEFASAPYGITYVLTAHPTEARAENFLEIFDNIQNILISKLLDKSEDKTKHLYALFRLTLKIPLAKHSKPTVEEEAQNIYRYILSENIIEGLVELSSNNIPVHLRTWVGGDKDGHPGVNEKVMVNSLNASRKLLVARVSKKIDAAKKVLKKIKSDHSSEIIESLMKVKARLKNCVNIVESDGQRILLLRNLIKEINNKHENKIGFKSVDLDDIERIFWIFPALVVPLEVREDSELVHEAANGKEHAITNMLQKLGSISQGYEPRWYVRGFVISMCQSYEDYMAGYKLAKKCLVDRMIPVIPLFETRHALENSVNILKKINDNEKYIIDSHHDKFGGRFEVMLGYSDSSKESGVLASRFFINNAMEIIDKYFNEINLTPVFFHGSGGSIERGGGSVREQTEWWPKSAIEIFKVTTQGEMVARTFANKSIFKRQVQIIMDQFNSHTSSKISNEARDILNIFAGKIASEYAEFIQGKTFLEFLTQATPYTFLDQLKIGSRPTKRTTGDQELKIRAIPWVLTWTQTRFLFPTWWGVGSTWKSFSSQEQDSLRKAFKESNLFKSYVKQLGFTLAKVELGVVYLYIDESNHSKEEKEKVKAVVKEEYELAKQFVLSLSGESDLIWFRPWLSESIELRSSMIHPLNLVQIISLNRGNSHLLRETVTGISCGMLTTG